MSDHLSRSALTTASNGKEAIIDDNFGSLDAAITEGISIDVSAGNGTISQAQLQRNHDFLITGATVGGRTVTFSGPKKRTVNVRSEAANTQDVTLVCGSTNITLKPGVTSVIRLDGTANGMSRRGRLISDTATALRAVLLEMLPTIVGQADRALLVNPGATDILWGDVASGGGGGGGGGGYQLERSVIARTLSNYDPVTSTWFDLLYDTLLLDEIGGVWSVGTPERITIVEAGWYRFHGRVVWENASGSKLVVAHHYNSGGTAKPSIAGAMQGSLNESFQSFSSLWFEAAAGDYLEVELNRGSGGAYVSGVGTNFGGFTGVVLERQVEAAGSEGEVQTEAGNYTIIPGDNGHYIRLTSASTKNITIDPEATTALPDNGEWIFRNVGAGDGTIVPGSGVTVNLPSSGTLAIPQGETVALKRVAADEFDLIR